MVSWPSGRLLVVSLLVLSTGLAGCLSEDPGPSPDAPAQDPDEEERTTGTVTVEVVDPGRVGIENVTVHLDAGDDNRTQTTNVLGLAKFDEVPPGAADVYALKEGYVGANVTIELAEGAHVQPTLELVSASRGSYVDEVRFEGFFDCSMTYLIITGDCFVLVNNLTEQAGTENPVEPTNEDFIFGFEVLPDWQSIRVRQEWDDPEFSLGTMMRINLEPYNPEHGGHADRYARTEGQSPIAMELAVGEAHENASAEDIILDAEGGWVQTRTFHLGLADTHNPGGTEFLGTGIAYQQRFTVFVEIEYAP